MPSTIVVALLVVCLLPHMGIVPQAAEALSRQNRGQQVGAWKRSGVEIIRDRYGVPHIFASSLADAVFGQGYCQAEDNLEPILAAYVEARGLAARAFGRSKLESDIWVQAVGLPQISQRIFDGMTGEAQAVVCSYAAGINHYLAEHPQKNPSWFDRVSGLDIVSAAKAYQLREQMSIVRGDLSGVTQPGRERDQADAGIDASNMWAVGPQKSRNGETMLLSDPHLPWHGATQWHEAHLIVGDRWIYGVTFFGSPGVGIGFTQDLAWGVTNNGADTADVYRIRLHPEKPGLYRYEDQWREISSAVIMVEVREPDGHIKPVQRVIRRTHHGPIIHEDQREHVAFAARLAGLEQGNLSEVWIGYFHARRLADLETLYDAGHFYKGHRIVADRYGDIGYYFFAATHERDDRLNWSAPVDGSISATEWGRALSWRDMPHIVNPPSGYLVNCNNNAYTATKDCPLRPDGYPRHLMNQSISLAPSTRAHRAIELIEACAKLDFNDIEHIATDVKTLTAEEYIEPILRAYDRAHLRVPDPNGRLKRTAEILRGWDRMATTDNKALPILITCLEAVKKAGGKERIGRMSPETMLHSLNGVLDLMEKRWGSFEIPWGRLHVIRCGKRELPIAGAGNTSAADPFTTLFMAGTGRFHGDKYVTDRGSSWMQLVNYHNDSVEAKTILPFGNSNDSDSPYFADQMPLFAARKLKTALLTRSEIDHHTSSKTLLHAGE